MSDQGRSLVREFVCRYIFMLFVLCGNSDDLLRPEVKCVDRQDK